MFSVHILLLRSTDDSPKVSVDVVGRWGRIIAATRGGGGAMSLPGSCDTRQVAPTGRQMGRSLCTSCCCAAPTILPRCLWVWWIGGGESSLLPGLVAGPHLCRGLVTLGKCHPRGGRWDVLCTHLAAGASTDDSPKVSVGVVDRWGRIIAATRSRGGGRIFAGVL